MNKAFVVSSASGLGYGDLRLFDNSVGWTTFGPSEIKDPRGVRRRPQDRYLVINEPSAAVWLLGFDGSVIARIEVPSGLDPGGGVFGPDGMYYVGSRSQRSIHKIDLATHSYCGLALSLEGILFPRGCAILDDGRFVVAGGTHPVHGGGRRALLLYNSEGVVEDDAFVDDPLLDPLDVALRGGDLYVTSEFPFGASDAATTLRSYSVQTGVLNGTWPLQDIPKFGSVRKPRGIAFDEDGTLLICAQNCVAAVDIGTSDGVTIVAADDRLAGQSLALIS